MMAMRRGLPSVQPRACGEQLWIDEARGVQCGSAPRVRGTGGCAAMSPGAGRFSPARAGNSVSPRRVDISASVQPRACGEQGFLSRLQVLDVGSAPRVRGTGRLARRDGDHRRFSPARAGNSLQSRRIAPCTAVQPRACGEQYPFGRRNGCDGGSAPRVRGTGAVRLQHVVAVRFSPARAGNSGMESNRAATKSVQPRACGEQIPDAELDAQSRGSAPRVRGTGARMWVTPRAGRFSPARAGNRWPGTAW